MINDSVYAVHKMITENQSRVSQSQCIRAPLVEKKKGVDDACLTAPLKFKIPRSIITDPLVPVHPYSVTIGTQRHPEPDLGPLGPSYSGSIENRPPTTS